MMTLTQSTLLSVKRHVTIPVVGDDHNGGGDISVFRMNCQISQWTEDNNVLLEAMVREYIFVVSDRFTTRIFFYYNWPISRSIRNVWSTKKRHSS